MTSVLRFHLKRSQMGVNCCSFFLFFFSSFFFHSQCGWLPLFCFFSRSLFYREANHQQFFFCCAISVLIATVPVQNNISPKRCYISSLFLFIVACLGSALAWSLSGDWTRNRTEYKEALFLARQLWIFCFVGAEKYFSPLFASPEDRGPQDEQDTERDRKYILLLYTLLSSICINTLKIELKAKRPAAVTDWTVRVELVSVERICKGHPC